MEIIADYQDLCGECPVWDPHTATLYWVDISGRHFYRYRPSTGHHTILNQTLEICGFRVNQGGGFVVVNNGGIWTWDGVGELRPIATDAHGAKCQMNDCTADASGRLLSGSCFYNPAGHYELGRLIQVHTDGRISILDEGFHLLNGIALSLDSTILYAADSVARIIYAYDYDLTTGSALNRRVLVTVPNDEGLPDGLTVDADGYLWCAQWYGSCVVRYDLEGTVERRLPTPAKQTSSVVFGGADFGDLFITTASQSETMPVMPRGYDAKHGNFGGQLYRARTGVVGVPLCEAKIVLPA